MEKKEATPPPEPNPEAKNTTPSKPVEETSVAQPTTAPAVQESAANPKPEKPEETPPPTSTEAVTVSEGKPHGAEECAKAILSEVQRIGAKVDSLEGQVKLLKEQRQKRNSENRTR